MSTPLWPQEPRLGPRTETLEEFNTRFNVMVERITKEVKMDISHNEHGGVIIDQKTYSIESARAISNVIREQIAEAERALVIKQRAEAESIPVDQNARVLTDGSPVTDDHRELLPNGQQKGYVVLSPLERAKGFVRPVRYSYIHKKCGQVTSMGSALAETYARDPTFYSGTFCATCSAHFPLNEFTWQGTSELVGS